VIDSKEAMNSVTYCNYCSKSLYIIFYEIKITGKSRVKRKEQATLITGRFTLKTKLKGILVEERMVFTGS
jgi:hypothetical protein